jgi:hypothetical protein
VAEVLKLGVSTLKRHYRWELDTGRAYASRQIARSLYSAGMNGNVNAMIFWLKTRAGWRESGGSEAEDEKPTKIIIEVQPLPEEPRH